MYSKKGMTRSDMVPLVGESNRLELLVGAGGQQRQKAYLSEHHFQAESNYIRTSNIGHVTFTTPRVTSASSDHFARAKATDGTIPNL